MKGLSDTGCAASMSWFSREIPYIYSPTQRLGSLPMMVPFCLQCDDWGTSALESTLHMGVFLNHITENALCRQYTHCNLLICI